jgi:hypothetical protein
MYLSRYWIETCKISLGVPEAQDVSILRIATTSSRPGYGWAVVLVDGEDKTKEYYFKTGG